MDKLPNEAFRIKAKGSCTKCGRETRGWIAYDSKLQVVNTEGFMLFENGITCDACVGEVPPFGGYAKVR